MPTGTPRRPRGRAPLVVLLSTATMVGSACSAGPAIPDFRGSWAQAQALTVSVRNQHFADIVVRVSRGGSWQRIGDVTGNSTGRFEIPDALTSTAGDYRFRVHAIGSSDNTDYITGRIPADRGDVIVLTVAPVLRMSSWSIRE
ncbi:MAG: hypothetical protein WD995_12850 [Gemmatimonadota bacterium]